MKTTSGLYTKELLNKLLLYSVKQKNYDLNNIKKLIKHGVDIHVDNDYALRLSARNGYLEIVKLLIDHDADIHADNDYALRWSAENGHLDVVKFLIEKGADIHVLNYYFNNLHENIIKYIFDIM